MLSLENFHFYLFFQFFSQLHGFLPVYNGKDTCYTCIRLRRNAQYKFRVCIYLGKVCFIDCFFKTYKYNDELDLNVK